MHEIEPLDISISFTTKEFQALVAKQEEIRIAVNILIKAQTKGKE